MLFERRNDGIEGRNLEGNDHCRRKPSESEVYLGVRRNRVIAGLEAKDSFSQTKMPIDFAVVVVWGEVMDMERHLHLHRQLIEAENRFLGFEPTIGNEDHFGEVAVGNKAFFLDLQKGLPQSRLGERTIVDRQPLASGGGIGISGWRILVENQEAVQEVQRGKKKGSSAIEKRLNEVSINSLNLIKVISFIKTARSSPSDLALMTVS